MMITRHSRKELLLYVFAAFSIELLLIRLQVVRDFLMQCFQKDPNLRVSARKLLKHAWIVSAKRSDAVVPKKPTEYEETVKRVRQWNEALKSPDSGSLRKSQRPMSSSPVPARRERPLALATPARGSLELAKPRAIAEQFRSPENNAEDNWDNDFASAISPSALQLPHLRPHDHFAGMLSSEKLKAYASFETVTEEANWDDNSEGNITVKSPMHNTVSDPLETIRPYYHEYANANEVKHAAPIKSPKKRPAQLSSRQSTPTGGTPSKDVKRVSVVTPRSTLLYRESSVEDYSDLIAANHGAFENKLVLSKVGSFDDHVNTRRTLISQ